MSHLNEDQNKIKYINCMSHLNEDQECASGEVGPVVDVEDVADRERQHHYVHNKVDGGQRLSPQVPVCVCGGGRHADVCVCGGGGGGGLQRFRGQGLGVKRLRAQD